MRAALLGAGLLTTWAGPPAQATPADVQAAVVLVIARGINTAQGNAPVAVQGTGFYISTDGYVATAHHLMGKLLGAGADSQTITFEIRKTPTDNSPITAVPLFVSPVADIMVLQTPTNGLPVSILQRTDRMKVKTVPALTEVFAAGYPSGHSYTVAKGHIKSTSAITSGLPGWTTSLTFKEGESGSPIMLADETVVAIARGDDRDASALGFIVPSRLIPAEYWDTGPGPSQTTIASSGSIRIEALATPTEPVFREVQITLANPHCAPPQRRTVQFVPTPGWRFDASSATISAISSRGLNGPALIDLASPDKIIVGAQLTNIGGCLINNTVEADITAEIYARLRFREVPIDTPQWQTVSQVSLARDVKAPLPDLSADKLRFSIVAPNGDVTSFKPEARDFSKGVGATLLDTGRIRERLADR